MIAITDSIAHQVANLVANKCALPKEIRGITVKMDTDTHAMMGIRHLYTEARRHVQAASRVLINTGASRGNGYRRLSGLILSVNIATLET